MHISCLRVAVLLFSVFALVGCAEFSNRGGFVDQIEDSLLFPATTKTHRLLRSYALVGAFAAVARRSDMNEAERKLVAPLLKTAKSTAIEAYKCLYPNVSINFNDVSPTAINEGVRDLKALNKYQPIHCMFFDEKMARLDYDIYKLAAYVLADRNQKRGFTITATMLSDAPLIGPLINATARLLGAVTDAAAVAQITANFVNDVIRLAYSIDSRTAYLFPVYRDIVELDMRIVIDWATLNCPDSARTDAPACSLLATGRDYFLDGYGDVGKWREFLRLVGSSYYGIQAYPHHFAVVSKWIFQSCDVIAPDKADCTDLLAFDSRNPKNLIGYRVDKEERILNVRRQPNSNSVITAAPAPEASGARASKSSSLPTVQ